MKVYRGALLLTILLSIGVWFVGQHASGATMSPPEFIRSRMWAQQHPALPGETALFIGIVVYDQRFSIHWEELKYYVSSPFMTVDHSISAPRPAGGEEGLFYNAVEFRMVLWVPPDIPFQPHALNPLILSYSYLSGLSGQERATRQIFISLPKLLVVPARIEAFFEKDAIQIGEENRFLVRISHTQRLRVLNEFMSVLQDEKASEGEKGEVQRWLQSLEIRKLSLFNLVEPELKPFVIKRRSYTRSQEGTIVRGEYEYVVSVFELPGIKSLGPFSFWTIEKSGSVPQEISVGPWEVAILTSLSPGKSEFEWLNDPADLTILVRWYGYPATVGGGLIGAIGLMIMVQGINRWARASSRSLPSAMSAKRISRRRMRRRLIRVLMPLAHVETVSAPYARYVRETAWLYSLALRRARAAPIPEQTTELEACSQSSTEVFAAWKSYYGPRVDEGIHEALRMLELTHVSGEAHFSPKHGMALLKCLRRRSSGRRIKE